MAVAAQKIHVLDFQQGPIPTTAAVPGVISPLLALTNETESLPAECRQLLSTGTFRYNSTLSLAPTGTGLYQALTLTASVKFSRTLGTARVDVASPVYARPVVNAALAEMSDGVPENREVVPASIARYAFPAAREVDYMRVLRPVMQKIRKGSSHGAILFKMCLYVLQAQMSQDGAIAYQAGARCGQLEAMHHAQPSIEAIHTLWGYDGRRAVSAGAMPTEAAYGGFLAAAAGAFNPVEGATDRLGRVSVEGDPHVTVLWSQRSPAIEAVPWADPETLAHYTATYAQSVGAIDTLRHAASTACMVPWAIDRGGHHWLDDVTNHIRVPGDRRHADLIPHLLKVRPAGGSFEEQVCVPSSLPFLAARVLLCTHSATQQLMWHLGAGWTTGVDASTLHERLEAYTGGDRGASGLCNAAVAAVFDINLGWSHSWGPANTMAGVALMAARAGTPSSVATRVTLPFQRYAYGPLNILGDSKITMPLRLYNDVQVVTARDRLAVELTARLAGTEINLFSVPTSKKPGTYRVRGPADEVTIGPAATGVQESDPCASQADRSGRRKAIWYAEGVKPMAIGQWMRGHDLACRGDLTWTGCGYAGPSADEANLAMAVSGDSGTEGDDFAWTRTVATGDTGYGVIGPAADPPPPPQVAEASAAGFGDASAMVDPALAGLPPMDQTGLQVLPVLGDLGGGPEIGGQPPDAMEPGGPL